MAQHTQHTWHLTSETGEEYTITVSFLRKPGEEFMEQPMDHYGFLQDLLANGDAEDSTVTFT